MNLKSKRGFTLVELIIVIAILGIIALIAVPSLTGVQKRSQVNADIRTAEQIGKTVRVWLTDATINEARKREADIKVVNANDTFKLLKNLKSDSITAETGLEEFISLDYEPNVTDASGNKLAFYVGLVNDKVVVVTNVATAAPKKSEITKTHKLIADNALETGVAYVEGISALTYDTIKAATELEVDKP